MGQDEEEFRRRLLKRLRERFQAEFFPDLQRDMTDEEVETWLRPTLAGRSVELSLSYEELLKAISAAAGQLPALRVILRLLGVREE